LRAERLERVAKAELSTLIVISVPIGMNGLDAAQRDFYTKRY
jgi:hypothetical protein